MTSIEYDHTRLVADLVKPPEAILRELTPAAVDVLHAAVGIATEAGELLDAAKKYAIYGQPLDRVNVIEELGDLEFYMEQLRQATGITRAECLEVNISKLRTRYGARYSDQAAKERADKQT